MASFETLMIKRTISVGMIITLLQQIMLCDYITEVSRNLTFIIFIVSVKRQFYNHRVSFVETT